MARIAYAGRQHSAAGTTDHRPPATGFSLYPLSLILLLEETNMPDFSWTEQHELIPRRAAVEAALAADGFVFPAGPVKLEPGGRPRSSGATADGRAQIELIGPEDIVFKATLLRSLSGADDRMSAAVLADCATLLRHVAPAWAAGPEWLAASLPALAEQPSIKTQFSELAFDLRLARDGKRLILGMTWQA
jgi:hypothetical protein